MYAVFVALLLGYDADGIDAFVHADGVFPVVGALCILGVILDAHSLVGPHVAYHHLLLHAPHLCPDGILGIAHLLDAVAR